MISYNKNFLFIHIPKTGGNSIQNVIKHVSEDDIVTLQPHQDGVERFEVRNKELDITKHSTLKDYKKQLPSHVFEGLYKFAVVRNPWDRLISFYFSPHRNEKTWSKNNFLELVEHVHPVRHYLCDDNGKGALDESIDFLVKFENLTQDLAVVGDVIGVDFSSLPHRNKSLKKDYRSYYDEDLAEFIFNRYREEIEFCGYEF